jgi:peptidoglycan/xylan/chitin deacetylase (PgdA/CDA1 family)
MTKVYNRSRVDRVPLAALLLCGCIHVPGRSGHPPPKVQAIDTRPLVCSRPADAGEIRFEKIAPWRDDAAAAYALVHDDLCGPELRGIDQIAAPMLEARGLRATLGAIVNACEEYRLWEMVRRLQSRGHEIGNHSLNHEPIRGENAAREIDQAKRTLDARLGRPVSFFLFPYDLFDGPTVEQARSAGHPFIRAGSRDDNDGLTQPPINRAEADNDAALEFDAWPRAFSKYALYPEKDILNVHVWNAIERRGFAMREVHSVTRKAVAPLSGEGFFPVPLSIYEAHLDFLVDAWRANQVWTDTASTIARYRRARQACSAAVTTGRITFDTTAADCRTNLTPLSVVVTTARDLAGLQGKQAGRAVYTRKLGSGRFSVTADPGAGPVELSGCDNPSPGVDPNVKLQPKPAAAASVCDLESVRAAGGDGRMDDLERPPEQLQQLPNPGQRDGRTGTWSWYPPGALAAGIRSEEGNRSLRYARSGLHASAGVVLAFVGASGAGSCYDATAYQGVRFRIRGTVESNDPVWKGKVILSLVTAETASVRYGGDRRGTGGHFHVEIPVSDAWQEVTVPFSRFQRPTWGDTARLTQLALGKLQAIDWGVAKEVSGFSFDLDDLRLY